MADPQSARETAGRSTAGNGRQGIPHRPVDRSQLLRRSSRYPFPVPQRNGLVRLRRARRVFGSFRGIPSLSRDRTG